MATIRAAELADVKTEIRPKRIQSIVDRFVVDLEDLIYIKWGDMALCLDRLNGWAFADITHDEDRFNPFSCWKTITPEFDSLDEALDFPVLDGKSVRERFDECRFFAE